ncbi:MAG: AzlD domain-containing protein [Lachnospiraceae bacterium]|jgi:branched-subunit amino acid transport protein|nr:AzlD domain-containing protein [Lachnospiraceae bacterium]MBQ5375302.1 AzlD domain-containing protein [Lachnospiraceae bacterium]
MKYIHLAIMIVTIVLIRVLPVTLIRKPIKNKFIRSFLYYVPYVTLAVMTFPAIMEATLVPQAGLLAFVVGLVAAWFGLGLFPVSIICCLVVFLSEPAFTWWLYH